MAIDVDFTQGAVNSFTSSGGTPTYGSDGVTFTITEKGDAPQLNSIFYIMFGKVEVTLKSAPGTGIVTSVVMQSDDLDEIDIELLGTDSSQVQLMYFGRGNQADNALAYADAPDNQDTFTTYAMDWSSERIAWSVGGRVVRVLESTTYPDKYPQTPMQIKFGIWAGGDADNAAGTISWAGGTTDYADGPFSATVQKIAVTDYSTGSEYVYGNMSGKWQSIESEGGEINANAGQAATVTEVSGASSTGSSTFPDSGISGGSSTVSASVNVMPSGWHMTSAGKIVPNASVAIGMCTLPGPPPGGVRFFQTLFRGRRAVGPKTNSACRASSRAAPGRPHQLLGRLPLQRGLAVNVPSHLWDAPDYPQQRRRHPRNGPQPERESYSTALAQSPLRVRERPGQWGRCHFRSLAGTHARD